MVLFLHPETSTFLLESSFLFSRLFDQLVCVNSLPGLGRASDLLPPGAGGPAEQDQGDAVGRQARLGASRGGGECPEVGRKWRAELRTDGAQPVVSLCCGAAEEGPLPDAGRGGGARGLPAAAAAPGGATQAVGQRPALAGGAGGLHHAGVRAPLHAHLVLQCSAEG